VPLLLQVSGVEPGKTPEDEQTDNTHQMYSCDLPMSCSVVKEAGCTDVTVNLIRTVSRFDVYSQAEGYELVSASVWNAYTESPLWETPFTTFLASRTERYYGVRANDNKEIVGALYAFENYVKEPAQKDKVTTCLIIGLKNLDTEEVEYFRTNVHVADITGHQLKRNRAYTTVVRSVNNQGDDTERGAYENENLHIDIDINAWVTDDNGILQVEGNSVLALPVSTIHLSSAGDSREYYIYTIGDGVPAISRQNLPAHISPKLELAPGYNRNSNFKASKLTVNATGGEATGSLNITFGELSGTIALQQSGDTGDFLNLNIYELPGFPAVAGERSDDIIVTASGAWSAEISLGDYLSFHPGQPVTNLTSANGNTFNIHTIHTNVRPETRYGFVTLTLDAKPEVKRILVVKQDAWTGKYIIIDPALVPDMYSMGGSTERIYIKSNGKWVADLTVENGDAGFNGSTHTKTISGTNDGSFTVWFPPLTTEGVSPKVTVTASIEDSDISESITIFQSPLQTTGLQVWTNAAEISNLANRTHNNYVRYVYNLGENMRNEALFGPTGTVRMPGPYQFTQGTITDDVRKKANIFQLTSAPTDKNGEMTYIKKGMDADKGKLLIISASHNLTYQRNALKKYEEVFKNGYSYEHIVGINSGRTVVRYFHKEADLSHPLVDYLLNGPFSQELSVNPNNISLLGSSSSTNQGLKEWPDTFIPLIMAQIATGSNKGVYCVFGIDPVNRMIWIGDPGIFGASSSLSSSYPNKENYLQSKTDNVAFLNNFIAWMTNAALYGEEFLEKFR